MESSEARPISYNVYFDERSARMTVVQVHPDSASMEHHMRVAGPAFARFAGLLTLRTMEVFGEPSAQLLEQMRQKVEMLGDATIPVHRRQARFARFDGVRRSPDSSRAS